MRRAFASLVLGLGLLCGTLTLAGWWFDRTVMDPDRIVEVADALFDRAGVRQAIADRVGTEVAPRLGVDAATVTNVAESALQRPDLAPLLAGLLRDVQQRLIGAERGPVVLDPAAAAQLVGDARVAQLPAVTFNVPTVEPLDRARRSLDGVLQAGLVFAVGFTLSGLMMHPSKPTALRTIGIWLLVASVLQLVTGYVIPVLVVPSAWTSPWADVVAETARAAMTGLVAVLAVLAAAGIVCLLIAAAWRPLQWAAAR